MTVCLVIYREFLPNATFGSGKNSHQPKFALAKYSPKNRTNEIKQPKIHISTTHKANLQNFLKNRSNEIRIRREPPVIAKKHMNVKIKRTFCIPTYDWHGVKNGIGYAFKTVDNLSNQHGRDVKRLGSENLMTLFCLM